MLDLIYIHLLRVKHFSEGLHRLDVGSLGGEAQWMSRGAPVLHVLTFIYFRDLFP